MSKRVVLHVGAMKSGTSFLQSMLLTNKATLLERGVLVPCRGWAQQVKAVKDMARGDQKRWRSLVREVEAHEGTSVLSMELLGPMKRANVERAVHSFAGAEVTIVVTARDLNRNIAAMWQESVQNGRTWTWEDYYQALPQWRPGRRRGREATHAGRTFWRQQNIPHIVRSWASVVGAENVVLITVPHPGAPRTLLWQRFASVLGIDPEDLEPAAAANESIGVASAFALRRLNELLEADGELSRDGRVLRKSVLSKRILAQRRSEEGTLRLPVADWVVDESARIKRSLAATGVGVVGDLDELDPVAVQGVDAATVSAADVCESALAGLAGLILDVGTRRQDDWVDEDDDDVYDDADEADED